MTTQRNGITQPVAGQVDYPSGRAAITAAPVDIRVEGRLRIDSAIREHIQERLGRKLAKYSQRIERTAVRLVDVNGPRGGIDTECRIRVVLTGLPSIVLEERATSALEAFDLAASGVPSAVQRALDREYGHRPS